MTVLTPKLQAEYDELTHYLTFAPAANSGTPDHKVKVNRHKELREMIKAAERERR